MATPIEKARKLGRRSALRESPRTPPYLAIDASRALIDAWNSGYDEGLKKRSKMDALKRTVHAKKKAFRKPVVSSGLQFEEQVA